VNARSRVPASRGFSLIELAVVVSAVAILMGIALDRLLPLIGRAQHVAFLHVRGDLQSALLLEAAERITRGEAGELAELAHKNPMALLLEPPANYLGSLERPDPGALPGASWYYDEDARELVYRVGKNTTFQPIDGPPNRVEFKVSFAYEDRDGDGVFDASRDRFNGLRLVAVDAYDWPN
jgi:prepilin-type N-terminal cleavage/methylation domain-containing protein